MSHFPTPRLSLQPLAQGQAAKTSRRMSVDVRSEQIQRVLLLFTLRLLLAFNLWLIRLTLMLQLHVLLHGC